MTLSTAQLRAHAEQVWWAGVRAVSPGRLISEYIRVEGNWLHLPDDAIDLRTINQIAIVGAGKAAGAMAAAVERALGDALLSTKNVIGWVNVPSDCVLPTSRVRLHAARAAGLNEPTSQGVEGTRRIFEIVSALGPTDLVLCVLSGGGSALLTAPSRGVLLKDKINVTRLLSAAGATIEDLNTVRQQLSDVKGGGLTRACRAGRIVSFVISDVLGDPLELIASGPTSTLRSSAPEAIEALKKYGLVDEPTLASIIKYLKRNQTGRRQEPASSDIIAVTNLVIGNNAMAVDAAGVEAERLGYSHAMISATKSEGLAEDVGRHLAQMALRMRGEPGPNCLISGGEPVVRLADRSVRGRGGRNQQLVLAALCELGDCQGIAFASGGTDGEDGPTDAAGAVVTHDVVEQSTKLALDARDFLSRNDAYSFFAATGGLFKTGPTHTNVCDLRVVTVDQSHHH